MVLIAVEVLTILLRWTHIASAVLLVGGIGYARMVAAPALGALPAAERLAASERLAERHRPLVYMAIAGLLVSGLYNYLAHPGHTPFYHAWFGVKMLLVAHVFAASVLAVKPAGKLEDERKRTRRLTGALISGLIVILIAALLRRIF